MPNRFKLELFKMCVFEIRVAQSPQDKLGRYLARPASTKFPKRYA